LEKVVDMLGQLCRKVEIAVDRNRIHVRPLRNAKADEMADLLSRLISGQSGASKKSGKKSTGRASAAEPEFGLDGEGASPAAFSPSGSSDSIVQKGGMFEDEVRVASDPSTNSLVITASPNDYQTLLPVIDQLDSRRAQVFIETLIMSVNINKAVEAGLGGHGGAKAGDYTVFGGSSPGGAGTAKAAAGDKGAISSLTSGFALGAVANKTVEIFGLKMPIQGAMFRALQTNAVVNVLSAPNILTTDNKKAEILVGKDVPMVKQVDTVQGGTQAQYSREKIGLNLTVTPQIGDGDTVNMEIEQKIQTLDDTPMGGAKDVTISEKSAKTTVVANTGQTIAIGGLIDDRTTKTTSKVPLLGDIPVLGYLFRDTKLTREKQNLIIFLTPHVIHTPEDMMRISVKKNNERRRFNKKQGIGENPALYDYDLDKGLDMAPKPDRAEQKKGETKRRFEYDTPEAAPDSSSATEESDLAVHRYRTNTKDADYANEDTSVEKLAEVPRSKKKAVSNPQSGNPFNDVRPPSSE